MCRGLSIGSVNEEPQREGHDPDKKHGDRMDVNEIGRSDHGPLHRTGPSDPLEILLSDVAHRIAEWREAETKRAAQGGDVSGL